MVNYELNGRSITVLKTEFEPSEGVYVLSAKYTDDNKPLTAYELEKFEVVYQPELYAEAVSGLTDATQSLVG